MKARRAGQSTVHPRAFFTGLPSGTNMDIKHPSPEVRFRRGGILYSLLLIAYCLLLITYYLLLVTYYLLLITYYLLLIPAAPAR